MFKLWSNQKIQFYTLFGVLGGLTFYLLIATLQVSLTCVDSKGCILEHCTMQKFNDEYKTIIELQTEKIDCPYALGSTRMQNLRADQDAFEEQFVDSCQVAVEPFKADYAELEQKLVALDLDTAISEAAQKLSERDPSANWQAPERREYVLSKDYAAEYPTFVPTLTQYNEITVPEDEECIR